MDEQGLERAIRKLCGSGPAPEPQRLAAILRRVEKAAPAPQRSARRWLPWLLLFGATAAMAAAGYGWYLGRAHRPATVIGAAAPNNVSPHEDATPTPAAAAHRTEQGAPPAANTRAPDGRSTVIYMR